MAGTTNAIQWNPTAAGQETDAEYLADSQRAGGATDPSLFDAALANKLFYQLSTYMEGLFTAFANKGYTTSDSNLPTLIAQCANFLTTADILPSVSIVAYAASLTLNAAAADGFYVTSMTGNLNIAAVNGLTSGQFIAMYYQQDATGGRTVTFPAVMVGAAQPDPTANAVSLQLFGYDSTTGRLRAFGPLVSNTGAFFPANVTAQSLLKVGSLTLTAPGTAGQVLTNVGGVFLPTSLNTRGAVTTNSLGNFYKWSDGLIEAWGEVTLPSNGGPLSAVVLTFPTTFTSPPVLLLTVLSRPRPASPTTATASANGVFTTTANIDGQCNVPEGGGGSTFDSPVIVGWRATGY